MDQPHQQKAAKRLHAYMAFRAQREGTEHKLTREWYERQIAQRIFDFFGVEMCAEHGELLYDSQNPAAFAAWHKERWTLNPKASLLLARELLDALSIDTLAVSRAVDTLDSIKTGRYGKGTDDRILIKCQEVLADLAERYLPPDAPKPESGPPHRAIDRRSKPERVN